VVLVTIKKPKGELRILITQKRINKNEDEKNIGGDIAIKDLSS